MGIVNYFTILKTEINQKRLYSRILGERTVVAFIYRLVVVLLMLLYVLYAAIAGRFDIKNLTIMSFLFFYFYFIIAVSFGSKREDNIFTGKHKLLFFIHSVGITNSFVVIVPYWLFLFPKGESVTFEDVFFGVVPHTLTYVLLLIDLIFFNEFVPLYRHVVFPVLIDFAYFIYSFVYYGYSKKWIYGFFDVTKPIWPMIYAILITSPFFAHLITFLISHLRNHVMKKYYGEYDDSSVKGSVPGGDGSSSGTNNNNTNNNSSSSSRDTDLSLSAVSDEHTSHSTNLLEAAEEGNRSKSGGGGGYYSSGSSSSGKNKNDNGEGDRDGDKTEEMEMNKSFYTSVII